MVIIGLIIGGVLVGQDLINAATIRAQISQIEKYNTAVHTFQLKYGGIPGDLLYTQAESFGFYVTTLPVTIGAPNYGDNNGLIYGGGSILDGEPSMFWRQLSDAKLISGNLGANLNNSAQPTPSTITGSAIFTYLPAAALGNAATIQVLSPRDGNNYFVLSSINTILSYGWSDTATNPLTAKNAYMLDQKIDDSLPSSGNVFAIDATLNPTSDSTWTTLSTLSDCVSSSGAYAVTSTTQACSLRFKFQ